MAKNENFSVVLFADLVRSTRLYEKLGDRKAQLVIGSCLSRLREVTRKCEGEVVKTIGDEVMSVFPDVDQAIQCSVLMHQSIEALSVGEDTDQIKLYLHIGLHAGPIVRKTGDVFGDTVNVAARLTGLAKTRQILTTGQTVEHMGALHRKAIRTVGKETLKGKSGHIPIYEYLWDKTDVTVKLNGSQNISVGIPRLEIRSGKRKVTLDADHPECTIGRNAGNDIVLDFIRISRFHAKIEFRRNRFVLVDHSSNGTYVNFKGRDEIQIKRDEIQLLGSGMISPGRKASPGSPGAIRFCVSPPGRGG